MIACFINSSGASISAGIVFYFASSIISGILIALIQKWEWIKWNPISMLNLQNQIGNEEIMKQLTHLSTNQMLFGNLAYIVLFLALGYLVFKRKNVWWLIKKEVVKETFSLIADWLSLKHRLFWKRSCDNICVTAPFLVCFWINDRLTTSLYTSFILLYVKHPSGK